MPEITEASKDCMRSFHLLSSWLVSCKSKYQDLMPPTAIEDEYGRFRVWCGNLGALRSGHSSLDFRLRESTIMQGNVLKLLEQLQDNLLESISVVSEARLPYEQQSTPDNLTEDDYFDSSSEDGDGDEQMTELQMRLSSIHDILNHMNKLSFKIRNAALRPKSLKATLYREIVEVDEEEKRTTEPVSMDEEARCKVVQWLELLEVPEIPVTKPEHESPDTGRILFPPGEAAAKEPRATQKRDVDIFDEYAKFDYRHMIELFKSFGIMILPGRPEKNKALRERLTQAITDRRRQIRYWSRHADKLAAGSSAIAVRQKLPQHLGEAKSATESDTQRKQAWTKESASTVAPPTMYSDTEITAPYNKKLDDVLDSQSVVSYASTAWDVQGLGVNLPPPPRAATAGSEFVCPYCSVLCPASHGKGRSWRAHLLQDLQAYMCTYDDCIEPNRMYSSRNQWAEHEAQSHRKVWQCYKHSGEVFPSPDLLTNHLRTQHAADLTESQISELVDVAETSLIDERKACPICFTEGPFKKGLQNHLANHLERIALFALPRGSNEAVEGSNATSNASQGMRTRSQDSWWSGPLIFSDHEPASDDDTDIAMAGGGHPMATEGINKPNLPPTLTRSNSSEKGSTSGQSNNGDLPSSGTERGRPQAPRISTDIEETPLDKSWGRLFDNDGAPTYRLSHVLRSLANHIIEDFEPCNSLVVTPTKMAEYYKTFKAQSELYHWEFVFKRMSSSELSRLYQTLECQHHLVPDDGNVPTIPGLTPVGFERWMTLLIWARPEEETKRLQMAISYMPNASSEDLMKLLLLEISHRLIPEKPERYVQAKLEHAFPKEAIELSGTTRSDHPRGTGVKQALGIAQNSEYGTLDPAMRDLLERVNGRIWDRLYKEPESYVLSEVEFAVFNFYQNEWMSNREAAEAAVRRFWESQPQGNLRTSSEDILNHQSSKPEGEREHHTYTDTFETAVEEPPVLLTTAEKWQNKEMHVIREVDRKRREEAEKVKRLDEEAIKRWQREEKEKADEEKHRREQEDKEYKKHLKWAIGYSDTEATDLINKENTRGLNLKQTTYTKIARRHISLETLRVYDLPYKLDHHDPEGYVLIMRWVPEYLQERLVEHTRRIREERRLHQREQVLEEERLRFVQKGKTSQGESPGGGDLLALEREQGP